ncbi:MAG: Ppx/GppA phosphatase family protein [Actinomycetota bacterium]|nr:Ppx/GppA phosphatase family protein [Actinomycetota bacterium]
MTSPPAVAAVDCGTNSTRLLVSDGDGRQLERIMTITRLGQGVDRSRALAPDAIARTVETLRRYREVMDRYGVGVVRMTATSAARDAINRDVFFSAAAEAVGADPELLGGDEEAALSFVGATAELDPGDGPWLVADIGGGSTELAVGPVGHEGPARLRPEASASLDVGCVRVTERFLLHDPPLESELAEASGYVAAALAAATAASPALAGAARLVGLAGTVSAAAHLDLRLPHYDRHAVHHHRLGAEKVAELVSELASVPVEQRRLRPGMEPERADVIVGGLVVLDTLLSRLGVHECLVSESDILDGLVMSLLAAPAPAARQEVPGVPAGER